MRPPKLSIQVQDVVSASTAVEKSYASLKDSLRFLEGGGVSRYQGGPQLQVAEDDLHFVSVLGKGACSVVSKALLTKDEPPKYVAVKKLLNMDLVRAPDAVRKPPITDLHLFEQMRKDLKILLDIGAQPGLVRCEGAFQRLDTRETTIVLEYMNGGSLSDLTERMGKIPEDVLAIVVYKVLQGLLHLHKELHIVHRDIKPANILLSTNGPEAKISDFGISRTLSATLDACTTFQGTVTYMSPERLQGQQYGFASDVWSLGLTVLECATGKYPYPTTAGPLTLMAYICSDEPPLPREGDTSADLVDFCRQCLHKGPEARASVPELLEHPFARRGCCDTAPLLDCMLGAQDPHQYFDEVCFFFATQYYRILTAALQDGPGTPPALAALTPLYDPHSTYVFSTDSGRSRKAAQGAARIVDALGDTMWLLRGLSYSAFHALTCDCSGLPSADGRVCVLLSVHGRITGLHRTDRFAEVFTLQEVAGGENATFYNVSHQALAVLQD